MSAAASLSDGFIYGTPPAAAQRDTNQPLYRWCGPRAFRKRRVLHRGDDIDNRHGVVYGYSHFHFVKRVALMQWAVVQLQGMSLGVTQISFDIPKTVVTTKSTILDSAVMRCCAAGGGWQGHGEKRRVLGSKGFLCD
jgi:hypothetical protein